MMSNHRTSKQETKEEFAKRLQAAIERKGWSAGRTAREARRYLSDGEHLSDAHMWHYLRARSIPRTRYLDALSRALEVSAHELVPGAAQNRAEALAVLDPGRTTAGEQTIRPDVGFETTAAQVRDGKNGTARLEINEEVSWSTALEILQLLKAASTTETAARDAPAADM